ncbi:uroplakin-3b [Ascaphus truei]|uniref:uroplakin-3b n=1 Tax=Ascaphus truei TaxID=8439 RepID=UPI003F59678D
MNLPINLWLLIVTSAVTFADISYYVPQITLKPIPGKLTSSTFVLDQPQCIFNQYPTNDVWLVVALKSVVPDLTDAILFDPIPYSSFATKSYYHILRVRGADYPCSNTYGNTVAILQVGSEVPCVEPVFCNAPLPSLGPYRVKFVVLNSTTTETSTRWSEVIILRSGMNSSSLDTWPGRRSAGMIVITTILSVLLAILLACLIAVLILKSKGICWCRTIENKEVLVQEVVNVKKYQTHHIYSETQFTNNPKNSAAWFRQAPLV